MSGRVAAKSTPHDISPFRSLPAEVLFPETPQRAYRVLVRQSRFRTHSCRCIEDSVHHLPARYPDKDSTGDHSVRVDRCAVSPLDPATDVAAAAEKPVPTLW